jgi:hypothetical protein
MVWVGIIFFLPLLGGCQDDEFPDEISTLDEAYTAIVGEWEWERTKRRYRSGLEIETPESEGMTRRIIFNSNKVARTIVNGEVTRETEYRIEHYASAFLLRYIDTGNSLNLLVSSDTLVLSNSALGHSFMYIKK